RCECLQANARDRVWTTTATTIQRSEAPPRWRSKFFACRRSYRSADGRATCARSKNVSKTSVEPIAAIVNNEDPVCHECALAADFVRLSPLRPQRPAVSPAAWQDRKS